MESLEKAYSDWDMHIFTAIDNGVIMNVYGTAKETVSDPIFNSIDELHTVGKVMKRE